MFVAFIAGLLTGMAIISLLSINQIDELRDESTRNSVEASYWKMAYEMDNVVGEIEEYKNDMKNEWEYYSTTHNGMLAEYYRGRYNSAAYLLEKVKECGRDDKGTSN